MKNLKMIFSKKFLPIFISMLLVMSMLPQSFIAFAEDDTVDYTFTVSNSDKEFVEKATITLEVSENKSIEEKTDSNGQALFKNLTVGTYKAEVSADGYKTKTVEFVASVDDNQSSVVLAKMIKVYGTVKDNEKTDVSNLSLTVKEEGSSEESVVTVNDAEYSFDAVEGKTYEITASADNCVTDTFNYTAESVDTQKNITLNLKTQKISVGFKGDGEVKVNGNPIESGNFVNVTVKSGMAFVNVIANKDKGYHIKSISGAFKYVNEYDSNATRNSVTEKSENLSITDGVDYSIEVEFEINKYDITVNSTDLKGNDLSGKCSVELSETTVEHGQRTHVTMVPAYGYNIEQLKVKRENDSTNDSTLEFFDTQSSIGKNFQSDDITGINGNIKISVILSEYDKIDKIDNAIGFSEAKNVNEEENIRYYSDYVTVNTAAGYSNFVINKNIDSDAGSCTIKETLSIKEVAVYNSTAKKWSVFKAEKPVKPVKIIIDKTAPELNIDSDANEYVNKEVTVKGSVSDEGGAGIQKVVYSNKELTAEEVKECASKVEDVEDNKVIVNEVKVNEDGTFSVNFNNAQNTTYYFYAIDNADNLSKVKDVTVQIDKTAPSITKIEFFDEKDEKDNLVTKIIKFFKFGIVSSGDVYVSVTVKDPNDPSSSGLNDGNISLKYINYKNDENKNEENKNEVKAELDKDKTIIQNDEANDNSKGGTGLVCTFKIPAESLEGINEFSELLITAKDNAGNVSEVSSKDKEQIESNAANYNLMISQFDPGISIETSTDENYIKTVKENDGKEQVQYWYNDDVDFKVNVSDVPIVEPKNAVHSGIQSVSISINGEVVLEKQYTGAGTKDELIKSETFEKDEKDEKGEKISTSNSKLNPVEGANTITVTVTGNNGKTTETSKTVYIDRNAPSANSVSIQKVELSLVEKFIKFLSFGNFFKEDVILSFGVSDSVPGSGLKSVTIYDTDKFSEEETEEYIKEHTIGTVNADELISMLDEADETASENAVANFKLENKFSKNVYVQVEDMVGNKSEIQPIDKVDEEDEIFSSYINLEDKSTKITVSGDNIADENKAENKREGTVKNTDVNLVNSATNADGAYYAENQDVVFSFKEEDDKDDKDSVASGLYQTNSSITKRAIDDTIVPVDPNVPLDPDDPDVSKRISKNFSGDNYKGKTFNDEHTYTTDGEGKYEIAADLEDNAGNTNNFETKTFYVDTYAPQVTKFKFGDDDFKDEKETDFEKRGIKKEEYGFYFKKKTTVTIYANDYTDSEENNHFASGVSYIEYRLVPKYGEVESGTIQCETKADKDANKEDAYITVDIPAGFKGQIYAKATDNVGHTGDEFNPYGVVIEETQGTIEFDRRQATEKQANGKDLYDSSVTVGVNVTDRDIDVNNKNSDVDENADSKEQAIVSSGIRSIDWEIIVPNNLSSYYKNQNRSGHLIINNKGEIEKNEVLDVDGKEITSDINRYIEWTLEPNETSNLIHNVKAKILVENDSNDITLKVTVTDRSGNTSSSEDTFGIDKTAPVVNITYEDNKKNNGEYQQYYNFDRTATITVTERNFDATRVAAVLENIDSDYQYSPSIANINEVNSRTGKDNWKHNEVESDPNSNTYTYVINYNTGDGTYRFAINKIDDRAGNGFNKSKSTYYDEFVIDKTPAQLTVNYTNADNGQSFGSFPGQYNNHYMRATFTLVEHNADVIIGTPTITGDSTRNQDIVSNSVVTTNSQADGVTVKQFPKRLSWTKVGKDTYQAVFELDQEAAYEIKVDGFDMAGNKIYGIDTSKFNLDVTKPVIKIDGIQQVTYAAYNDEKITPSVSVYDEAGNIDESSINITVNGTNSNISTLTNHELFDLTSDSSTTRSDITNGFNYVTEYFNNDVETKDDIYTLHIDLKDRAENAISEDYYFSVNRYGSTYIYDMVNRLGEKFLDGDTIYTQSILGLPLFTEINCDFLDGSKTELSVTYTNTANQKQTQAVLEEGKDYEVVVKPNDETDMYNIKRYTYQLINADLFELDGVYQIFATSYDGATNINKSNQEVGQVKNTQQIMKFVVDKNAPRIDAETNFEKFEYTSDEHTSIKNNNKLVSDVFSTDGKKASLNIAVDEKNLNLDAIDKASISVTYDGNPVESTVEEVNGVYQCSFDLDSTTKGYDLVITASDKASNNAQFTVEKLLVSNNWFIRFINNKVALGCTIGAVVALAAGIIIIVILKKKKTKIEEE